VAQERQPGGTTGGLTRPVVMAENPSNHAFVDLDVELQGICCAIRGQPQLGLRCFISTTARMSTEFASSPPTVHPLCIVAFPSLSESAQRHPTQRPWLIPGRREPQEKSQCKETNRV